MQHRFPLGLFAAFAIITPTAANGADWRLVDLSANGTVYYIDSESIREQTVSYKRVVVAWFKTDETNNMSVAYREAKVLYHFDCPNYEMKAVQYIHYRPDGTVMNSDSFAYPRFVVAAPDTIGYAMLEAACFGKFF